MEPTVEQIGDVLTAIVSRADAELMAMEEADLAAQWYWRWEESRSIEWNAYRFSEALDMYRRQCRRWEEHHNGSCCVVERVRDKYLMPRVREFLAALATHNSDRVRQVWHDFADGDACKLWRNCQRARAGDSDGLAEADVADQRRVRTRK